MGNTQSILYGKQIKCSWGSKPTPPGTNSNPLPPPAAAPTLPGLSATDLLAYERHLAMTKMGGFHTLMHPQGQHPLKPPDLYKHLYSTQKSPLFSLLPSKMAIPFKLLLGSLIVMSSLMVSYGGNFYQDFDITWGDQRAKIFSGGQLLSLSLDKTSGSGFISKKEYLFGRIDMQLKLVAGNSAGTVTAYYLSSQGPTHDEIDFEFLGNLSGDPYIVHTNVFTQGKGNREQQFYLWFDPTRNFHTYSIVWTSQQIIFLVDNTPIRVFKNGESIGVPFPKNQPMKIYSSLWNADDWATRGGLVKADWTKAPFTAYYRGFNVQTCTGSCTSSVSGRTWQNQELDAYSRRRLRWVQKNFMIYNYCTDLKRFPQGLPPECKRSRFL